MADDFTILDLMTDPALFGGTFGGESFAGWRALLGAFYGLPLDAEQAEAVRAITARERLPKAPCDELWTAIGRRGGKSHVAALVAVYEAACRDYSEKLSPGEVATVFLIAADRAQARTLLRYVRGMADHPMLRRMVKSDTAAGIELTNGSAIEVATASHRAVRGYTCAAVVLDEIAFWMVEGARPDAEIVAALRPSLATLGGRLIAISSPYARRGVLWDTYRRHYGNDDSARVLVAQAPSRTMNPTLPERVVDDAMRDDAARASAEYLAQFRSDISTLIDPVLIESAVRPKPLELPRAKGIRYQAFVDPSGGGADEFTLCIGHREGEVAVIDLVRGLNGSPAQIVQEYVKLLRAYGIFKVTGDRYAGRWPGDEFRKAGVAYHVSDLDRSGLYLELLAQMNSGRVEVPPCQKLGRQLLTLERRTGRSGRDMIDHPPGGHDDRANAVAGLVATIKAPANTFKAYELRL